MSEDKFKSWLENLRDFARESYNSCNSEDQPFDEMYEMGMYHAYNHVLAKYEDRDLNSNVIVELAKSGWLDCPSCGDPDDVVELRNNYCTVLECIECNETIELADRELL